MTQFSSFLTLLPMPHWLLGIVIVLLIIGGTFLIISRRDLTAVEGIGLLLLVWVIPVLGVVAVMSYLWFVGRWRRP